MLFRLHRLRTSEGHVSRYPRDVMVCFVKTEASLSRVDLPFQSYDFCYVFSLVLCIAFQNCFSNRQRGT